MLHILLVGQGGRENAMARALCSGSRKPRLFIAPGNPGTAHFGQNVKIDVNAIEELVAFAQQNAIDFVVVGPEVPLVLGLANALARVGIPCCGPTAQAAQLEGSKIFTRELGRDIGLPAPKYVVVDNIDDIQSALATFATVPVLKANGLSAGKGVFLPDTFEECASLAKQLLQGSLGKAGESLLFEERLTGPEASLFFACYGTHAVALPHAQDHKRLLNHNQGPNTGGMGAISPNPLVTPDIEQRVYNSIVYPTLQAMHERGMPFVGFLFVGLMLTATEPKLIEFNVRLGDPESQSILPRFEPGDFLTLCEHMARGTLHKYQPRILDESTCAIVVAAQGYPDAPQKGQAIVCAPDTEQAWFEHAGTQQHNNTLITAGGRVGAIVAKANTLQQAQQQAYQHLKAIHFQGMQYRTDIGDSVL